MYLESEKILLQKNYRGYHNSSNTTYVSNIKPTEQVVFSEGITSGPYFSQLGEDHFIKLFLYNNKLQTYIYVNIIKISQLF